jgi:hypothetical protein
MRANDLKLIELEMSVVCMTLTAVIEPSVSNPCSEQHEPMWDSALIDMDDPKFAKSRVDNALPILQYVRKDNALPIEAKLIMDNELPARTIPRKEREDDIVTAVKTLSEAVDDPPINDF